MVCRRRAPASELVRVGFVAGRGWYLGAGDGRGAWVCASKDCDGFLGVSHLARALRREVRPAELAVVVTLLAARESEKVL